MKAVILNGSRKGEDTIDSVHDVIVDELQSLGWAVEPFILRDMEIRYCVGCFGCWVQTPGVCLVDDTARDVAREVIQSDLAVFLTPVTFGGYSSELKKALDRIICLIHPYFMKIEGEVHHRPRYDRYPRLMGVGVLPEPDEEYERIFKALVSRNAINMHAPAHVGGVTVSSQGEDSVRETVKALLAAVEVKE